MNIVLVFPPFYLGSLYNLPPLGLINLGTVLREAGHRVVIQDHVLAIRQGTLALTTDIYDEAAALILGEDPDLVGFSVQCTTFPSTLQLARRLKERKPAVTIVAGGHDVSFKDVATLERFPWIDAVVRGEGEATFPALAAAFAGGGSGEGIAGVTWRQGSTIICNPDRPLLADLDTLPLPDYALVQSLDAYRQACGIPRSIAILEVGRGCPHRCVYCSESALWRRTTRTFSVPRLVQEMRHLAERFGAECLVLAYDQFTADRRFVEAFCQAVLAAGLQQLPWYCISRLDSVDAPLLALMREAGCESLCYGIDSGSPRTLAFIGKEIDAGILGQRVRETTATGIVPTLSFVIGFPEEERSDLDATLQLALMAAAQGDVNPLVQLPTVLAGTGLADRYGAKLVREVDTYFSLGLEFDGGVRRLPDDEQLIDSDPPLFSSFYNLPCAGISLGELDRIARWFPLILSGYPKTLLLLCATVHESPSLLLGRFLAALSEEGWHAAEANAEARFLDRFPSFAAQVAGAVASGPWRHLPEVITYETLALRAAPCPHCDTAASGDAGDGQPDAASRPVRAGHVTVGEFTRNMAAIIADLRQGIVRDDYPVEPSILVFHPLAGRVEVTEINPFGRDLLAQCDGAATCAEIAGRLYQDYGTTLALPDFTACCADALATFGSLALVRQGEGDHPTGKEVIPC